MYVHIDTQIELANLHTYLHTHIHRRLHAQLKQTRTLNTKIYYIPQKHTQLLKPRIKLFDIINKCSDRSMGSETCNYARKTDRPTNRQMYIRTRGYMQVSFPKAPKPKSNEKRLSDDMRIWTDKVVV